MRQFLSVLIMVAGISGAQAQPYFFEQDSEPYVNLSGSTSINAGSIWTSFESFAVPIGFTFDFMGNSYTTVYVEGSGFARFDASYYYLVNPFTVPLEDKGTSSSLSPLSYKLEGSAPARILKIEWNNCGFVNDASGTANFQLWFYETSNIIEVHMGTSNAVPGAYSGNGDTGPAIGIYEFNSLTYCLYGIGLTGNPAAATANIIQNTNADLFDYAVSGTPASGIVYRFVPGGLGSDQNNPGDHWKILVWNNTLSITTDAQKKPAQLVISDMSGKIIMSREVLHNDETSLNNLSPGFYLCTILEEGEPVMTQKIVLAG